MNSDRRLLALAAFLALGSAACAGRTSPKPPSFPGGGLLAGAKPPPNPWLLRNALEGVYDTTSRFGSPVVVHASAWGAVAGEVDASGKPIPAQVSASVSILARDHYAFAVMQAGCLKTASSPTTQLVLEGYWRYLDDSDPDPSSTGLVRLFVQPQPVVDYVCGTATTPVAAWDSTQPIPALAPLGIPVTFTGATGAGENLPGDPLTVTWNRPRKSRIPSGATSPTFAVGVHHGACQTSDNCGVSENTAETSILSVQLGGDYLEIDSRVTKDGVPVFFHLGLSPNVVQGIYCSGMVEDYTYAQLSANCRLRNGELIPRSADAMEYIFARTPSPLYIDSKTPDAVVPMGKVLAELDGESPANLANPENHGFVRCNPRPSPLPQGFDDASWPAGKGPVGKRCLFPGSGPVWQRGIIGLPTQDAVDAYTQAKAAGEFAPNQHCLIEEDASGVDTVPCVAWMPRYTRGPMTSEVHSLQSQGYFVGYWTISDPATIDAFLKESQPNGILTNYLGLLNQRFEEVGTTPPYALTKPSTP